MNLSAYDKINRFIPGDNYIQNSYKRLLSKTIEYHDRYCILKKYNPEDNNYSYFVAVYDYKQQNVKDKFLKKDNNGNVKVYLTNIWKELPDYITTEDINISVELIESHVDGKVYKLIF